MKRERLLRIWSTKEDVMDFKRIAYIEEEDYGTLLRKMMELYKEKMRPYRPELSHG